MSDTALAGSLAAVSGMAIPTAAQVCAVHAHPGCDLVPNLAATLAANVPAPFRCLCDDRGSLPILAFNWEATVPQPPVPHAAIPAVQLASAPDLAFSLPAASRASGAASRARWCCLENHLRLGIIAKTTLHALLTMAAIRALLAAVSHAATHPARSVT
jgi:hypothetical protein